MGVAGGRSRGGGAPRTIVSGVWGQALSLRLLLVLVAGSRGPLFTRCGCECAGVRTRHWRFGVRALWGPACRKGGARFPWGGTTHRREGRLLSGVLPLAAVRPWGRRSSPAARSCLVRVCGRGDPALFLCRVCPARYRAPRGWQRLPRGQEPLTIVRAVWCQVLSLCQLSIVRADGRAPLPMSPRRWWCGCGGPAPAPCRRSCEPALRAVGVAGGRPRGGASHRDEGLWGQVLSLPLLPVLRAGTQDLLPTCCGRG